MKKLSKDDEIKKLKNNIKFLEASISELAIEKLQLIEDQEENDEIHAQLIDIILDLYEQLEAQEPSEKELEELVKTWNSTLLIGYKLENVHGKKDYSFALKQMLKEYRELLRRG